MNSGSRLTRMLDLIRTKETEPNYFRGPSHILLFYEYLRRLNLWTTSLDLFHMWWRVPYFSWWASDLGTALVPTVQVSLEIEDEMKELYTMQGQLKNAVKWAAACDQVDLVARYQLPDPYEPLLLMYRRDGEFYADGFAGGSLSIYSSRVKVYERYEGYIMRELNKETLRHTPYVELDERILDEIDAPLRVGWDYLNYYELTDEMYGVDEDISI